MAAQGQRVTPGKRVALTICALALASCVPDAGAAQSTSAAPQAQRVAAETRGMKTAVLAGGCFWGVEAVFSHVKGVTSVVSGYHGGPQRSATYELVSSGMTDHVEAVRITYDPAIIRYDQLLRIFFSVVADPTLKDRQGPDSGPQYDAQVIPASAEQLAVAKAYLAQLKASGQWSRPIVTPVVRAQAFYPAEAYHQDFAARNPDHSYVRRWDRPKVRALQRMFPGVWSPRFKRG
jgi:peptide-methionine (S)-S-oxide reductase